MTRRFLDHSFDLILINLVHACLKETNICSIVLLHVRIIVVDGLCALFDSIDILQRSNVAGIVGINDLPVSNDPRIIEVKFDLPAHSCHHLRLLTIQTDDNYLIKR
jgi:hypothetical protein